MTGLRSTSTTRLERISKRHFSEEERHGVRRLRPWGDFDGENVILIVLFKS